MFLAGNEVKSPETSTQLEVIIPGASAGSCGF